MVVSTTSSALPIAVYATTQLPVKLTATNFSSWRAQFDALLFGYGLVGYVNGSFPAPASEIEKNGQNVPNPEYSFWMRQNKLILLAIFLTISENITPFIAASNTSMEAWQKLIKMYANKTQSRIMDLKDKLSSTRRDTKPVGEYLHSNSRPVCKLCDKVGHLAKTCRQGKRFLTSSPTANYASTTSSEKS
ncbi:hypothetical protein CCACVL1_10692 [Corchorus capsularis]|uniref:Zinc finger, CCHC-type n=1 Tax=Corchorus capsularis TaxID=210143 RepID=A0A1R3IQ72_COCAP|nr:hypothetical protein CCACVL1_10692 [Corchorus capsularis]